MQLAAKQRRAQWHEKEKGVIFEIKKYEKQMQSCIDTLPFTLTQAQQGALDNIII